MLGPQADERGGRAGRVRLSSEYKKVYTLYTLFCHRARDGGADTKANPNPKVRPRPRMPEATARVLHMPLYRFPACGLI